MRWTFAALTAFAAAASPAAAQSCGCEGGYAEPVVVPHTRYVPRTSFSTETVLVPRTQYERRVVYVPRTRLVPRTVEVPRTVYVPQTTYSVQAAYRRRYGYEAPSYGPVGYPGGYHYGATYVPPGAAYGCHLGVIGCDSGAVGPIGY